MNKKLFFSLGLVTLLSTNILFEQATDDNEIRIDQEGDTLTLYIDQVGFGNKISQTSAFDDKMVITGTTLTIDIDMIEEGLEGTLEQGKDIEYWNVMGRTKIMRVK